jgi:hypothetical protein
MRNLSASLSASGASSGKNKRLLPRFWVAKLSRFLRFLFDGMTIIEFSLRDVTKWTGGIMRQPPT